jgi:hypothetical protein
MSFRIPAFLAAHPWESLLAACLLLGLLFISADDGKSLPGSWPVLAAQGPR